MRRIVLAIFCLLMAMTAEAQEKKLISGFDGGMMVHTGYLSGNLDAIGYRAEGFLIGGGLFAVGLAQCLLDPVAGLCVPANLLVGYQLPAVGPGSEYPYI